MSKKDNYNYFKEFLDLANYIVESAETLKEIMNNFNVEKLKEDINLVHKLENEADNIVHDMRERLIKDFLPPIDREDIALIITKLDDIEDGIDEVLINVKILNITEIKPEVLEFIDVLIVCANAVKDIFIEFDDLKKIELINQKAININKLEEQGDRIYEKLISDLYTTEKDPINILKWNKIYNCLEKTIDYCESLGDCIQDVVMKNS